MESITYFISGTWGDALFEYNAMRKDMELKNIDQADIVYFGYDMDIYKLLKNQKKINKVYPFLISDNEQYLKYLDLSKNNFSEFLQVTNLGEQKPNMISANLLQTEQGQDWLVLPPAKMDWNAVERYLVFHPFSCQSCFMSDHWQYWMLAIDWILETYDVKIVMTGQLLSEFDKRYKFPWIEHNNLINLVDQTASMIDVFHLAQKACGVLTTSSALSTWSHVLGRPTLTVCNKKVKDNQVKYQRMQSSVNTVLDASTSFMDFKESFKAFYAQLDLAK